MRKEHVLIKCLLNYSCLNCKDIVKPLHQSPKVFTESKNPSVCICFRKAVAFESFAKFTGKHLCRGHF